MHDKGFGRVNRVGYLTCEAGAESTAGTWPSLSRVSTSADPSGRRALVVAGAIALAQALALVALGVLDLTHLVAERVGLGVGIAVLLLVFGLGLGVAAFAVMRGRHIGRGPVLVAQLISLGLAWNLRGAGDAVARWLPAVLVVTALVVLACLFSGPGRRAMSVDDPGA